MTAAERAVEAGHLITIGELSRRTGLAISALRYYEEVGLLEPQARVSGQRRYAADAVDAVGLIRVLRDVHFTLGEIDQMARDGWRALARRKMTELDDLIAHATAARAALDHALQCPHDEPAECPTFWSIVKRHQAGEPLAQAHRHSHPEPDS
jgi:MerR family transcriptional regulator, copper efflux regulator